VEGRVRPSLFLPPFLPKAIGTTNPYNYKEIHTRNYLLRSLAVRWE
jgi:hypothetical protein